LREERGMNVVIRKSLIEGGERYERGEPHAWKVMLPGTSRAGGALI